MNFIDYCILLFILIGAVNGYRKGLIQSIVGLVGNFIALFLAIKYRTPFGDWLDTKFSLSQSINDFISYQLPMPSTVNSIVFNQLPYEKLVGQIQNLNVPTVVQDQIIFYLDKIVLTMGNVGFTSLSELLIKLITSSLVYGLAFLIIWVLADKFLEGIALLVTKFLGEGVVGNFNKLLGLIVGTVISLVSLTIIIGIFSPLITVGAIAEKTMLAVISKTITESTFVPYFINTWNLLLGKIITFI